MPVLLDTNIISFIVRDPKGQLATRLQDLKTDEILTSVIVVGEIAYGFAKRPAPKLQRQTSEILKGIHVAKIDRETARQYAHLRASLERSGTTIGANDMWIAAHALALDAILVTANEREFDRVPGLTVENWAA